MNQLKSTKISNLIVFLFLALCPLAAIAQSGGTSSSYSRFGLGLLNDQAQGWNRAMGGVGVALPSGNKLNTMNPASYAHLDSLSFILDAGMSGKIIDMSPYKDPDEFMKNMFLFNSILCDS